MSSRYVICSTTKGKGKKEMSAKCSLVLCPGDTYRKEGLLLDVKEDDRNNARGEDRADSRDHQNCAEHLCDISYIHSQGHYKLLNQNQRHHLKVLGENESKVIP